MTKLIADPGSPPCWRRRARCRRLPRPIRRKPIKVIVSTTPGGVDRHRGARARQLHHRQQTGQPVVIDNRAGRQRQHRHGGGGARPRPTATRSASPIPATSSSIPISVHPYDFRPAQRPHPGRADRHGAAVPGDQRQGAGQDARGIHRLRQGQSGQVNYAGAGAGTTPDLAGLEFMRRAGLKLVMVPFKGTAPATTAVIGGDVQVTFVSMGPHIELRAQRHAARAGRRHPQARALHAGHADLRRAGLSGLRDPDLVLVVRAARHPERDRRAAQLALPARSTTMPNRNKRLDNNIIDPLIMTAERVRRTGQGRRSQMGTHRARDRGEAPIGRSQGLSCSKTINQSKLSKGRTK